jgi:hypothetical protein
MVDLAKRVSTHGADLLDPGETVLGALTLIPPSGVSWMSAGGATGNLLGAAVGAVLDIRKDRERDEEDEPPPQAAKFPVDGSAVVAATDKRLVFFTLSQGRAVPKEIFLEIPYTELAGLQRQNVKKRVTLRFVLKDGRVFDASTLVAWPNKDNAEKFFQAFERMAGGSQEPS